MGADLWSLYQQMLRSRRFEELVKELWEQGRISGEMHLGVGEEAIAAGVVDHIQEGDAMALDHRGTPPLVVRGIDLVLLLREFLGNSAGLCSGMGGHMHLFSGEHLSASSGIVGSSAPLAAGFALAAQYLRPTNIAVGFFGEGAMNQGMLMESLNLAVAWKLPVLFVCKENRWAITTRSHSVTGGNILERVKGFGMPVFDVDGTDVEAVWNAVEGAAGRARNGEGPSFLLAHCPRLEGHFLGDPLMRGQVKESVGPLLRSLSTREGAPLSERIRGLGTIFSVVGRITTEQRFNRRDPIERTRRRLKADKARLDEIEKEVMSEMRQVAEAALSA